MLSAEATTSPLYRALALALYCNVSVATNPIMADPWSLPDKLNELANIILSSYCVLEYRLGLDRPAASSDTAQLTCFWSLRLRSVPDTQGMCA